MEQSISSMFVSVNNSIRAGGSSYISSPERSIDVKVEKDTHVENVMARYFKDNYAKINDQLSSGSE